MRALLLFSLAAFVLGGCVSTRKFNSARAEAIRLEEEAQTLSSRLSEQSRMVASLQQEKGSLLDQKERAQAAAAALQREKESLAARMAALEQEKSSLQALLEQGSDEASRMLAELQRNQAALEARSERVEELEALLRTREEAIAAIRRQVSDALLGFDGKGLSISTREGKVYVSMEDKLLFRSGSYEIGAEGARAVRDLAAVLAANPDINVMVEGHTDDVPYVPNACLRDNLDLSAKRATTVVRLLLENRSIAPSRIIAAGRGESLPVAAGKTAEARARNRRTEIILTPKLDELLKLMD